MYVVQSMGELFTCLQVLGMNGWLLGSCDSVGFSRVMWKGSSVSGGNAFFFFLEV